MVKNISNNTTLLLTFIETSNGFEKKDFLHF